MLKVTFMCDSVRLLASVSLQNSFFSHCHMPTTFALRVDWGSITALVNVVAIYACAKLKETRLRGRKGFQASLHSAQGLDRLPTVCSRFLGLL